MLQRRTAGLRHWDGRGRIGTRGIAFSHVGLDWKHVVIDPKFIRPAEVDLLMADPRKAAAELQWRPAVSFDQLVRMMVDADMARVSARR